MPLVSTIRQQQIVSRSYARIGTRAKKEKRGMRREQKRRKRRERWVRKRRDGAECLLISSTPSPLLSLLSSLFLSLSLSLFLFLSQGLMGNPSDGFHGKTISFTISNFFAEVVLWESDKLLFLGHPKHDGTGREKRR
jgi:hypothetical protein